MPPDYSTLRRFFLWALRYSLVAAGPLPSIDISIFKRATGDPCDLDYPNPNGTAIFGCNSHPLGVNGACPITSINRDCASFCEVRRRWYWGREIPLRPRFIDINENDEEVVLDNVKLVFKGVSYAITPELMSPLSVFRTGLDNADLSSVHAEYDYSRDKQKIKQVPNSMKPYCGYFTFIPMYTESCGSISKAHQANIVGPNAATSLVCDLNESVRTYSNQCITYPARMWNRNPAGRTIVGE
ncbi:hypothetical protein ABW19_dt0201551 [Dactylella cylindrospora]|nr:hypothetical protein ABW19_dt0201551 [Dactylella cylindrospora]